MTLSKKTLLTIFTAITGLIGVLYVASSTILLNSVRQAEAQQTRQTVAGVVSAFTQTQEDFDSNFADWAAWDDTYEFAQDGNQNYIKSNFYPDAISTLKVNLAVVVKPSGKLLFGTGYDLTKQKKTPVPTSLKSYLSPHNLLLKHPTLESSTKGILLLPEGAMQISSRPILTNAGKGPIGGTIIFGRFLDAEIITKLAKSSRSQLTLQTLNEIKLSPNLQTIQNKLGKSKSILVSPVSEKTMAGYTLLPDIYGKPSVLLKVTVYRDIYRQAKKNLNYLIASLVVAGVVFGGVILLLIKQLVLSERKWQQSEEYRNLVAQASESIFIVDAQTKLILENNGAFQKLLGYQPEQISWLTIYDLVVDKRENINDNLLILHSKHYFTGEQQYRCSDGKIVDVEINANLISRNGRDVFCIIVHDITKRKQVEQQLIHDAFHDSLTGLANRALFMDRLEHSIQLRKRRDNYLFAVLFLDLDRFKVINDSLGHLVGDKLLIAIAQRLRQCLRSSDTFARLGGDEFAILLENCSNVTEIVERLQQEFKLPFNLDGEEVFASTSIGVIIDTTNYAHPEELLRDADIAMYRAKAAGKARHEIFDVAMHNQAVELLQMETDLRWAVEHQEFQLHYQPIISLRSHKIVGFEALVRWQHPMRGLVSPAEFIPIAEETGLIIPLGWWVLQEACRQMRAWQIQYSVPLTISVNFSVKQFTQPHVVEQIKEILAYTNLAPQNLSLEITESVLIEYSESITAVMEQLKALGVSLSLDDFGTGYSSLSYLHRFPIDTLKIDRSFIGRMNNSSESWEIVRAIITLAQALGIEAIAEGVETSEQLNYLSVLECEYAQGYFFAKPLDSITAADAIAQMTFNINNIPVSL